MHDAIEAALAEFQELAGGRLLELVPRDKDGLSQSPITVVTDDGGPFRAFSIEAFIAAHPELRRVHTRVCTRARTVPESAASGP